MTRSPVIRHPFAAHPALARKCVTALTPGPDVTGRSENAKRVGMQRVNHLDKHDSVSGHTFLTSADHFLEGDEGQAAWLVRTGPSPPGPRPLQRLRRRIQATGQGGLPQE